MDKVCFAFWSRNFYIMNKSKLSSETPRTEKNESKQKKPRENRSRREIVEANLRALKHTRMAFQR
jgi:hypothetical protein